jgi:chromosomal replication initiation ATPase DnaA
MSETKEIKEVVELLCDALRKYGKKKIIKSFSLIQSQMIEDNNHVLIDMIIDESCKSYNINKSELFKDRISTDATPVKELSISLIKKHTNLSHDKISQIFAYKNRNEVSKCLTSFKNKSKTYKPDVEFIQFYNSIDENVNNFKLSL